MTDAITIQNPRNRGGSTGHVLAKRSVTFTEIRNEWKMLKPYRQFQSFPNLNASFALQMLWNPSAEA